jgi:hypothetical protein
LEVKVASSSERKLKYGHLDGGEYSIEFPVRVTSIEFEPLLKKFYEKSKRANEVIFDFSNVAFFDSFELGLITTWFLELKNANINIKTALPSKNDASDFLRKWEFEGFLRKILKEENITTYNKDSKFGKESENSCSYANLQKSGFTPLTFAFDKQFNEYFSQKKFQNLEYDLYDYKYINTLRDIVIYELVENIHKHAKDTNPYIIMTVFRSKDSMSENFGTRKSNKWNSVDVHLNYGPNWEKSFFKTLSSPRYLGKPNFLELVIGDGGPGIPATLGKIEKCKRMSDVQIVDYAFEFDSTSDPEGRIRQVISFLSNEGAKFPPATGLYQVKEILKRYGGFLSVRSGNALVYYDFLTNEEFGKPVGIEIPDQSVVNFKGTHYKIYFPLTPPSYFTRREWSISKQVTYPTQIKVEYIIDKMSLKEYFHEQKDLASQAQTLENEVLIEMGNKIISLKEKIRITPTKESSNRGILLVDFEGINKRNLPTKILHYLILNMMRRQDSSVTLMGINASDEVLIDMQILSIRIKEFEEERVKDHSLIIYSEKFEFNFIETKDGEKTLIEKLREKYLSRTDLSEQEESLIESDTHIVEKDSLSGKYYSIKPENEILAYLVKNIKEEIKNFILDESKGIFNPNVKILIPGHYYVEGFFELGKIKENKEILEKIRRWVLYQLILLDNPPIIITTNKNLEEIIDSSIRERVKKWIKVADPLKTETIPYADLVTIDKEDKICVFSSAIGSGESINKILEITKNKNVLKIFSIIDAREIKISPKTYNYSTYSYNLESIIERPLKFYFKEKPPLWNPDSISSVDIQTYSIIVKPLTYPEEPIWIKDEVEKIKIDGDEQQIFSNKFIEKASKLTNSLSIGHMVIGKTNKHLIYNFEISKILEKFETEIADCIIDDLNKLIGGDASLKISHILHYTDSEPFMENLAGRIANHFGENKPNCKYISYEGICDIANQRQPIDLKGVSSVILLVDFMSSGFTLKKLIDTIAQSVKYSIIIYVLINRADMLNTIFLSNISFYKESTRIRIRYLASYPIPVFELHNCPVCKYIDKLEQLRRHMNDFDSEDKIWLELLQKEIKNWEKEEIISLFSNSIKAKDMLRLRWLLEIAKTRIGAREQIKREVQKSQEVALDFLSTLYTEILYFFDENKKVFDTIFYPKFKQVLKEKCKTFAKNIKILLGNAGPIILVWYYIDSEDFYNHIGDILSALSNKDINMFWNVITFILIAEHLTGDKNIDKLTNISGKLPPLKDSLQEIYLRETQRYLKLKGQTLIPTRLYYMYLDAKGGDYELGKRRKEIDEGQVTSDLVRIIESAITLYEGKCLKGLDYIFDQEILIRDQKGAIQELEGKIVEDIKYLKGLLNSNYPQITTFIDFQKEIKDKSLLLLDDLIRLRKTIDKIFMCDLPKTIDSIINEKKDIIKKFNIKVDTPYRGINWFAFVGWDDMERILREIFDNLEHAFKGREGKDNKVKILITQTSQEPKFNVVNIQILDNGNPVKERVDRQGHSLIKSLVEIYSGNFQPLQEINPRDERDLFKEGYIKKTAISLIKLELPQERE